MTASDGAEQGCDVVIYNKKYILGFHLHSWQSSENAWNFLNIESNQGIFCYVNEVAFGKPLGHLRMETGC